MFHSTRYKASFKKWTLWVLTSRATLSDHEVEGSKFDREDSDVVIEQLEVKETAYV
jgi:hypothetical protein